VGAPVVAAYAAGQMFYFVATGDNTGAVTLNIDSLGAKAVTRDGSVALAAGDIKSGEVVVVVYDGTRFQVVSQLNSAGDARFANVSIASSLYVGGVSTFVGNAGFSANVSIASALSVGGVAAITGATTIGGNLTLNGGTANGVLYLNGSKVATSGSGLTFDGTNLGIGGSPSFYQGSGLLISRSGYATIRLNDSSGGGTAAEIKQSDSAGLILESISNRPIQFNVNASEQMRLTSTGLGIGTSSPSDILTLAGGASGSYGLTINNAKVGGGTKAIFQYDATNAIALVGGNTTNGLAFQTLTSGSLTTKATIDSSGNLGLGVTPSAWGSAYRVMQIGVGASYSGGTSLANFLEVGANFFTDTGGVDKYIATSESTKYRQVSGIHSWYNAPSGTAGNAISFTQAMTLDADGRLALGSTSILGSTNRASFTNTTSAKGVLALQNTSVSGYSAIELYDNGGTQQGAMGWGNASVAVTGAASATYLYSTGAITFLSGGTTERARITSGGYSKFSNNGTYVSSTGAYHEFHSSDAAQPILYLTATSGSYTGQTIYINNTRAASSAYKFYSANANAVEQFYVRGDGVLYAQNTTIQSLSDGRLKENIRNATEGLDVINALRPIRYDWKTGFGNDRKNQLGFVAQEVEAVFPDAVSEWSKTEGDEEAYKTVGPGALIPVLVKAIQELTARVAQLETK
jgi:hypothetical protein